ncbi:hypothetical protein ACFQUU_08575 [Herbaspirillum sp. GCM10030257]
MNKFELIISRPEGVISITAIGDVGAHMDAACETYGVCGITVRWPQ